MKILMMTNIDLPIVGGLEKSSRSFSERFRARGHEVKIVSPEFPNKAEHEKDVIRVPAFEKIVRTDFSVSLPLPGVIRDVVDAFKPDIIHSHVYIKEALDGSGNRAAGKQREMSCEAP